jgi:hypothetical protein
MTENSHLTPHCPDVGKALLACSHRIVSLGMMGGGPFILLKVGQSSRKRAKQAQICVAGLPTILSILRSKRRDFSNSRHGCGWQQIPWDMDNSSKIVCFVI